MKSNDGWAGVCMTYFSLVHCRWSLGERRTDVHSAFLSGHGLTYGCTSVPHRHSKTMQRWQEWRQLEYFSGLRSSMSETIVNSLYHLWIDQREFVGERDHHKHPDRETAHVSRIVDQIILAVCQGQKILTRTVTTYATFSCSRSKESEMITTPFGTDCYSIHHT